jgi:hypothetical protein
MKLRLWVPTLLHFFTDFFSMYALYKLNMTGDKAYILITVYNLLAFIPQPLIGAVFENSKNIKYWGSFGCLLVVLGALIPEPITAVIFFGLGNAFFHVGEGKVVLLRSEKAAPLGVFISFGAIGVGVARQFISSEVWAWLFWVMLFIFLAFNAWNLFIKYEEMPYEYKAAPEASKTAIWPLALICLGVFLRGFVGQYTAYTWSPELKLLFISLAVFLGKFVGGFILDLVGPLPLIVASSVISFTCSFFPGNMWISLVGLFGVNLLMALTMELMRKAMPQYLAFGFGLLAAFLLIGTYSGYLLLSYASFQSWLNPTLMALNCLSLVYVYINLKKERRLTR